MPDVAGKNQHRPLVVLYFNRHDAEAFKALAERIRSESNLTTLVWSHLFRGADDLIGNARAIVVQHGCPKEQEIVNQYVNFGNDVEVHYANDEGEFIETPPPEPQPAVAGLGTTANSKEEGDAQESQAEGTEAGATTDSAVQESDDPGNDGPDPVSTDEGSDGGDAVEDASKTGSESAGTGSTEGS